MNKYQDGKATRYAFERILDMDTQDEEFAEGYIETLDYVSVFRDEIKKNLITAGFTGNMENTADIINFVCECCERTFPNEFEDPNDKSRAEKLNRKTLARWLSKDEVPKRKIANREIMYKLCFALKMDENTARNFFYKGCLERPFNFKNIRESVYYFCLKHRKSYSDAMRIINQIEAAPVVENEDADSITSVIANRIRNIASEAELVTYLTENRNGFVLHNSSAYRLIENMLLPSCKELATKELKEIVAGRTFKIPDHEKAKTLSKNPDIEYPYIECDTDLIKEETIVKDEQQLSVIYGYDARATTGKEEMFKYSISDKTASKFPKLIKENFPQWKQFDDIKQHKASADVVRKALIMLYFYEFFTKPHLENSLSLEPGLFDEFINEMRSTLEMCGYGRLYWRNPFDWMIGCCAREATNGGNPVDKLRNFIDTFYLSQQE